MGDGELWGIVENCGESWGTVGNCGESQRITKQQIAVLKEYLIY